MMSTALQDIRKEIAAFTLTVRKWTDTLPVFNFEVTVIQRRTARRLVIEYIESKRTEIRSTMGKERSKDTGTSIGRVMVDGLSAAAGTNLRPKARESPSTPRVVISADGELSVSRSQSFVGISMDENEFCACLDQIEKRVNEDPIDVETQPEIVAKTYLVEVYRTRSNNLPTFQPAI